MGISLKKDVKIPQKAAFRAVNCGFRIGMQKAHLFDVPVEVYSIHERLLHTA